MKAGKPTYINDTLRILPGLLISSGLLILVFWNIDIGELKSHFQNANYALVGLAIFISLLGIFSRTIAWRTLLRENASFDRVFWTINEGYLINNILPFRMGEIGRALLLSRVTEMSFMQVFSTIVVERIFDLILTAGILIVSILYVTNVAGALSKAVLMSLFVLGLLVFLFILARNQDKVIQLIEKTQTRFPQLPGIISEKAIQFLDGLSVLVDFSLFTKSFGWMLVTWVLIVLQYYLVLIAFIPDANLLWASLGLGLAGIGVAIPSAPGGIGVMEATLVFSLGLFNVQRPLALAYSLILHAIYLFTTSFLGVYGLMRDGGTIVSLYNQLRNWIQRPRTT